MKIILLRHTSLDVEPDTFYGQSDVDVGKTFLDEVVNIKKKLKYLGVLKLETKVITSPLQRCKKLTEKLTNNFKTDVRLKELNFGDWEMLRVDEITKKELEKWNDNLMNFKIPNGESNKMFFNRVSSFCDDYIYSEENLFLICHAGTINCIISYLTNVPFEQLVNENWKRIKYGSITILERNDNTFQIKNFAV